MALLIGRHGFHGDKQYRGDSDCGHLSYLADGSTFTVGSNTYQVSYEDGDGNDLTLTVVP